jgi:hypothetical protein
MVQIVVMLVNGNIGAGVAVAGAFSLVRFRSVPGGAKEIGSIFFSMALGFVTGMGFILFAFLFFAIVGTASLILTLSGFGEGKKGRILRILIPESLDYEGLFDDIFEEHLESHELEKVRTTSMGSLFELTYLVTIKGGDAPKAFIDEIRARNGNLVVSISRERSSMEEL